MATPARVILDETSHTYTRDGVAVPGVTQVLEDAGIIDYSAIPDGTRVMALERGRFVHQVCQFHDEGDLGEFDPQLSGYLEAWKRFRDLHKFTPELIEHVGYSAAYAYAGTLDRKGGEILLDIKTSVAPYWTAMQTAAYSNFFDRPGKYRRMGVELHADGTFRTHDYRCSDFSRDLNVFLAALTVYNAKRKQ